MRVYCSFEHETIRRATRQVVKTLLPVVMTPAEEFAEVVITGNLNTASKDTEQYFILVSSEKMQQVPENVSVITEPLQLPELLTALSQQAEKIDVSKKRVLIYDPHHYLADDKLLYDAVYNKHERFDVDLHATLSFDEYCKLARNNTQYQLVLSDCFPSTGGDFSHQAQERVNSEIKKLKSRTDAPIVLIEECEGYEKEALRIGADGVLQNWHISSIAEVIDKYIPREVVEIEIEKILPENLIGGKIMKILVVDDNPKHQASARETLAGHDVTIVSNFHQAQAILRPRHDSEKAMQLEKEGLDWEEARKLATPKIDFDAVLSDLLMPKGSQDAMGPKGEKFIYDELAYGYPIAMLAAKAGIPVVVATDTNHHDHPMSYTFDLVGGYGQFNEHDFMVNGSKVMFRHAPLTSDGGKDWGKLLAWLLGEKVEEE